MCLGFTLQLVSIEEQSPERKEKDVTALLNEELQTELAS